jgi:cytochrome oxidase Cu insertion factor (SCO1/SenC/PrrC family)
MMTSGRKFIARIGGVALLFALVAPLGCSAPQGTSVSDSGGPGLEAPASGSPGYRAPDFTVTTFAGERFNLAAQKGMPVVLNFWESW